jgi:cation transporter-like permease
VTFERLTSIVRIANILLVLTSVLYALIMYFGLGVSFKGGLGGLAHICGALYMALIIFVLLLPWQNFFGPIAMGATYTPGELASWCTTDMSDTLGMVLFYLRFTGYWALVMMLLLLAQLRSFRWARAILR